MYKVLRETLKQKIVCFIFSDLERSYYFCVSDEDHSLWSKYIALFPLLTGILRYNDIFKSGLFLYKWYNVEISFFYILGLHMYAADECGHVCFISS